jgi:hypothetical protein
MITDYCVKQEKNDQHPTYQIKTVCHDRVSMITDYCVNQDKNDQHPTYQITTI